MCCAKQIFSQMNQLPDTALIVVATLVGFVTGVILLGCILVIWNHCVRGRRKSVKKHQPKERYVPLDPHPSFDFVRVEDHSLPQAEEPSKPFHFESRSPSPQPGTPAEVLEKRQELYRCIQDFEPRKIDDVKLEIGDQVNIYMTFTDGWCHGFNITKNTKGIFPIQCIRMETFDQDSIYSSDSEAYELPPKAPEGSGKLLFSMM
jgi:hypothetical protein